jgi:hypothetical protein
MHNSNQKPVIMRPVRGILRGKIHRTMAVWPAVTQASSSLPDEQRLCDLQEVTSPGAALCRGAAGQAACCEVRGSRPVPPGGAVAIMAVPSSAAGHASRPWLGHALGSCATRTIYRFRRCPCSMSRPALGMTATGARQRTHALWRGVQEGCCADDQDQGRCLGHRCGG